MDNSEKQIIKILLSGGTIVNNGQWGIRIRDKKTNPVMKATARRFYLMKDILKKNKKGLWVISPKNILKLHGNSWIKAEYKKQRETLKIKR